MGPTLWRLLAVMTEWVWDRGVRGAVGVVGVWGRLKGGDASGADLDNVTLDTKLSWKPDQDQTNRETQTDRKTDRSMVSPLITPVS